jgi:hypothetical protein
MNSDLFGTLGQVQKRRSIPWTTLVEKFKNEALAVRGVLLTHCSV